MRELDARAAVVSQEITCARSAADRYRNQAKQECDSVNALCGGNAMGGPTRWGEKKHLARTALEVFTNSDHLKRSKDAHDLVSSIGGLDELGKLVEKAQKIKDRKVDPEMLEYDDVLAGMSLGVNSIGVMGWDDGGKSFVKIRKQYSDDQKSTDICFTCLVGVAGRSWTTPLDLPRETMLRCFQLAKGDNVQRLFNEVCESSNMDILYKTNLADHHVCTPIQKHEFVRIVTQQTRDGINKCAGLSNILSECERATGSAMSKRDGKRPMAAPGSVDDDDDDDDDDEPVFTKEVTREQRDEKGYENAIIL